MSRSDRCYNKTLDMQRQKVKGIDIQRLKIQEVDGSEAVMRKEAGSRGVVPTENRVASGRSIGEPPSQQSPSFLDVFDEDEVDGDRGSGQSRDKTTAPPSSSSQGRNRRGADPPARRGRGEPGGDIDGSQGSEGNYDGAAPLATTTNQRSSIRSFECEVRGSLVNSSFRAGDTVNVVGIVKTSMVRVIILILETICIHWHCITVL